MTCKICGQTLPEGSNVCKYCGAHVRTGAAPEKKPGWLATHWYWAPNEGSLFPVQLIQLIFRPFDSTIRAFPPIVPFAIVWLSSSK